MASTLRCTEGWQLRRPDVAWITEDRRDFSRRPSQVHWHPSSRRWRLVPYSSRISSISTLYAPGRLTRPRDRKQPILPIQTRRAHRPRATPAVRCGHLPGDPRGCREAQLGAAAVGAAAERPRAHPCGRAGEVRRGPSTLAKSSVVRLLRAHGLSVRPLAPTLRLPSAVRTSPVPSTLPRARVYSPSTLTVDYLPSTSAARLALKSRSPLISAPAVVLTEYSPWTSLPWSPQNVSSSPLSSAQVFFSSAWRARSSSSFCTPNFLSGFSWARSNSCSWPIVPSIEGSSPGPAQASRSPIRAACRPLIRTVGEPSSIGPPMCCGQMW